MTEPVQHQLDIVRVAFIKGVEDFHSAIDTCKIKSGRVVEALKRTLHDPPPINKCSHMRRGVDKGEQEPHFVERAKHVGLRAVHTVHQATRVDYEIFRLRSVFGGEIGNFLQHVECFCSSQVIIELVGIGATR